jgi:GAF domain-containing protein
MSDLRAAVAAGALGSEESYRELLQSIVEVARAIFGARASSVFLHDEESDELVFEAVAGEGADELVGQRFPSSTGIAGWVLVTRQPLVVDELDKDPRFAREAAESTGFVPKGLMAVPLLHEDQALGVLEVLDRPAEARFSIEEVDLLGLFGIQAAAALALLRRARLAAAALAGGGGDLQTLGQIATRLATRGDDRTVADFLAALDALLARVEER